MNNKHIEFKIKELTHLIRLNPVKGELFYQRGDLYFDLAKYQLVIKDLEDAIKLRFENVNVWYLKGLSHDKLNQLDQALLDYQNALEFNPNFTQALNNVGYILLNRGEFSKAEQYFRTAAKTDSNHAKSRNNLGNVYLNRNQFAKAIIFFDFAIEIDPRYSNAYVNRSQAYFMLDRYKEAWEDANYVIEYLRVNHPRAYAFRGYSQIMISDTNFEVFKSAFEDQIISIKIGGEHPIPLLFTAKILDMMGDSEKAIEIFKIAIKLVLGENRDIPKFSFMKDFTSIIQKIGLLDIIKSTSGGQYLKEAYEIIKKDSKDGLLDSNDSYLSTLENEHLKLKRLPFNQRNELQSFLKEFLKISSFDDANFLLINNPLARKPEIHNLIEHFILERCKPIEERLQRNLNWIKSIKIK